MDMKKSLEGILVAIAWLLFIIAVPLIIDFFLLGGCECLPATVIQENPLILEVEDGRQYQILEASGSENESYFIYVDRKTGRLDRVIQAQRTVFKNE